MGKPAALQKGTWELQEITNRERVEMLLWKRQNSPGNTLTSIFYVSHGKYLLNPNKVSAEFLSGALLLKTPAS